MKPKLFTAIFVTLLLSELLPLYAVLANNVPDPKITRVLIDKSVIELGEWITVTVNATNYGYRADEMYISISLPENPPMENIEIISSDLQSTYKLGPGDKVWGNYGKTYPITLQYPLVEGYKWGWEKGETKYLKFKFKPHKTGIFQIYVKTTAQTGGQWRYDPTSGTKDQQDEYVYVYEINVKPAYADLINKYFPMLIYDEKEKYFPTDFFYDDTDISNNHLKYDDSWPFTVYVHTSEFHSSDGKDYLCIEYWFYYVRDDGIKINVGDYEVIIGGHDHDWESVFVFLEKTGTEYNPAYAAYFHHVNIAFPPLEIIGDCWSLNKWGWPSFDLSDKTHPIVHVCRNTHASDEKTYLGYGLCWITIKKEGIYEFEIPVFEPCDGGKVLKVDNFNIVYVDDPDPSWPSESFGEVQAPWKRQRWNDPNYVLKPYRVIKSSFSILGLAETEGKLYLHVYDNESRHVGFNNETLEVEKQIPDSYYEDLGNTTFIILPENITNFIILIDATYAHNLTEEYNLSLATVRNNKIVDETTIINNINKGERQEFDVELSPTGEIIAIPEFSLFLTLPLFMIVTLPVAIVHRKKRYSIKQKIVPKDS